MIDNNDPIVEENLIAMKEHYGSDNLGKMTPGEFYTAYKKFSTNIIR